ncbi:tegument protein UL16 [Equid alphaherpesvirus 4]|uniref:46 n=1 Tax=Equine herpesvirus 4 (strain 1942) TaxID=10333 RepID=O39287_EHV4|nr:tegument protein UL16 [Equid alphaherpesvirus 4]AAC59563.1 46 [Equid alphaherpesvirus 4]
MAADLNSYSSIWEGSSLSPNRQLTIEAANCLTEALTEDIAVLRLIRSDPRVKIFMAVSVLTPRLARFAPPQSKLTHTAKCAVIMIYLTRPKALALQPKQFHVLVTFSKSSVYSLVMRVKTKPFPISPQRFCGVFQDPEPIGLPSDVPNPATENIPTEINDRLDVSNFATQTQPPKDKYDCCVLAPGVWWYKAQKAIYFLQMDEALLALCPAGWKARGLGIILGRLLNHQEGCSTCRFTEHSDPLNATADSVATPESCLCWAPCLWRKSRQRELKVEGDRYLFRVLFMDAVERVRLTGLRRSPKITADLADLVVGIGSHGQQIPVNSAGWKLVALDANISKLIVCGCYSLRYLCPSTDCKTQQLSTSEDA